MLIEKIAIFILFLGPLVFFHELGHFLFARFFGVKVEVFSIGFGPKLFKFKFKDDGTEYAFSLIPLGGYVKMYGDNPLQMESVPEEKRSESFTHKGKWARFWIVMGGPLANFILAYAIFFSLFMYGERIPEIRIGAITDKSELFVQGFRAGDILRKVNGNTIFNPSDIVLEGDQKITTLTVEREDRLTTLNLDISGEQLFKEIVKVPPFLRKPLVVSSTGKIYALTKMRKEINWKVSLDSFFQLREGTTLFLYPVAKGVSADESGYTANFAEEKTLTLESFSHQSFFEQLFAMGFLPIDLRVKRIVEGSPADKAGVIEGDVIVSIDDQKILTFMGLKNTLQKAKAGPVQFKLWSSGRDKIINITPDEKDYNGVRERRIGIEGSVEYLKLGFFHTPSKGFVGSFINSFPRTWEAMYKTFDGFIKLFSSKASFKSIGGPLSIGKVASDSFNTSISYFFQLMALISINLGIINLFPIPVLDGGHIVFIFLELINRGPVSKKKLEIAQQVGMSILLLIMIGAIFNDFSRFF